jgi:hypothetical protein
LQTAAGQLTTGKIMCAIQSSESAFHLLFL